MRGPEGVVDIHVGQRGQGLGEPLVVLLLAGVKAEIFEQKHVAGLHLAYQHLGLRPDTIFRKADFLPEQSLEAARDRCQAHARIHLPLGPVQVGAQDHTGAFVHRVIDGGEGASDAGIVRDVTALIQRDVEVRTNDDTLSLEGQVFDGDFVQMHGRRRRRSVA